MAVTHSSRALVALPDKSLAFTSGHSGQLELPGSPDKKRDEDDIGCLLRGIYDSLGILISDPCRFTRLEARSICRPELSDNQPGVGINFCALYLVAYDGEASDFFSQTREVSSIANLTAHEALANRNLSRLARYAIQEHYLPRISPESDRFEPPMG